ncbi:leucyl aminopeptidase [Candidatus Woesearchaeota archaeon]|nr:leucyl aminopeptidase [Candidatus Woesearchaeota archaeon]
MKINIKTEKPENVKSELLIIGHFEKEKFPHPILDKKLKGRISKAIKEKKFEGEFKQIYSVSSLGLASPEKVLLVGLGKKKDFDIEKLRQVAAFTAKIARDGKIKDFRTALLDFEIKGKSTTDRAQALTEGMLLGLYKFTHYKTDKKEQPHKINEAVILTKDVSNTKKGVKRGEILAEATNYVRDLVNIPACDMTPTVLANEAKKIAKKNGIKIKIFGKKELQKKKMNAILGVSSGSTQEPKLILMETNPKAKKKMAIVGKGITFDSGGLDIKPSSYMLDMKCDMAGAAAVLGTVMVAAKLKLPINVLGVMVASENMTGGAAQKPGDIVTAYNKKTIEIANTDAEGRLVLADAVAYAEEKKPVAIVDIATLTGTSIVVLGYSGAPLISNDEKLKKAIKKAADETHEKVWELPIWEEFREAIKGELADVRNLGKGKGYEAGTITAATFIEAFIKKTPWAHLDIGGVGWFIEDNDYVPKGGTGYGVRLLVNFLENWK